MITEEEDSQTCSHLINSGEKKDQLLTLDMFEKANFSRNLQSLEYVTDLQDFEKLEI